MQQGGGGMSLQRAVKILHVMRPKIARAGLRLSSPEVASNYVYRANGMVLQKVFRSMMLTPYLNNKTSSFLNFPTTTTLWNMPLRSIRQPHLQLTTCCFPQICPKKGTAHSSPKPMVLQGQKQNQKNECLLKVWETFADKFLHELCVNMRSGGV